MLINTLSNVNEWHIVKCYHYNNQKCFLSSKSAYYNDIWRSCDKLSVCNDECLHYKYKNYNKIPHLQSQITTYVTEIHQQNNLLKRQLLAFKLKLTIFEIPLISRGNLFHKSAPEYLKDLVLKRQCNIHNTLRSFITMLLIYPKKKVH